MRTSSNVVVAAAATLLLASSAVLAHASSNGGSELLSRRAEIGKQAARRAISDGAFDAFLDKRGEAWGREANGPEECGDDEEWVPYQQQNNVVEKEEAPKAAPVEEKPAPAPAPAPAPIEQPKKEEVQAPAEPVKAAARPTVTPASGVTTPDNIPEGTYTVEEGCTLYHNVVEGEMCLGLLEIANQQGFGTTLEELYCLNPAIDELCYNLQIDNSYCIAYSNGTTTLPLR